MYCQILLFGLYAILICTNLDQMYNLYSLHHMLFCFILGNIGIVSAEILLTYMLRINVNLSNKIDLYRISLFVNIAINFYGIWGFAIRVDKSVKIPGLFVGGNYE